MNQKGERWANGNHTFSQRASTLLKVVDTAVVAR